MPPRKKNRLGFACRNGGFLPVVRAVKCVWQHQQNYNVSCTSVSIIRQLRGEKNVKSVAT